MDTGIVSPQQEEANLLAPALADNGSEKGNPASGEEACC